MISLAEYYQEFAQKQRRMHRFQDEMSKSISSDNIYDFDTETYIPLDDGSDVRIYIPGRARYVND